MIHSPRSANGLRLTTLAFSLMLVGSATLALTSQPAHAAEATTSSTIREYRIGAGTLGNALAEFAATSGVRLAFDPAIMQGKQTPGLRGAYGVSEGFAQLLQGSGYRAVIRSNGEFALEALPDAVERTTTLPAVTVKADAGNEQLPAAYAGGQVARGSRAGLLGNKDVMDLPFNITSYTSELMENQQAITVADVMANDPSVRTVSYGLTNAAGAGDSFMIRGFYVQNGVLFDGLTGIAPSRTFPVETAERIEVLKGPNALLNGMAPYDAAGGAINMVPKRAGDVPLTRLTATYLSKGVVGGHLDMGRRFGENNEWGIRVNGIYRDGKTATAGQSIELGSATIAIDYRSDTLRASLDAGHQTMNNEAPQGAGGIGIADGIAIPAAPSASRQIAQDWEYSKTRSDYVVAKLEYDLRPDWTLYGAAGGSNNRTQYLSNDVYVLDAQGNALATTYYWPSFANYRTVQGGLRGTVLTGDIKHQINLNASYLKNDDGYTANYYGFSSFSTNIYHPVFVAAPSTTGFSSRPPKTDTLELPSLAISDTISLFDDRLAITLGARHQRVKYIEYDTSTGVGSTSYDESAITPVLAIVFKPLNNLSLYGNYIEGLNKGNTASVGTTNAGQVFPPIKSKQYEVGAKYDFGHIATTVSLFNIQKPSGMPVSNGDGTYTYKMDGEQRNRGIEFNVFGEIARNARLLGGITYTSAKLTHTENGTNDGNTAPNVSRWLANLGGEFDPQSVPGLTVSARTIATGSQYLEAENLRSIPGWTRWDIAARYKTRAWNHPLVLRAGIENLFNRNYWASGSGSWIYLGNPRTLSLSASMDF